MKLDEITLRIAGEAGQGMKTIGHALSEIFVKAGLYIFANMDYMSRIRGGNNFYQVRVSTHPVYTLRERPDIVVALNKESVSLHKDSLNDKGMMILDASKFGIEDKDRSFYDVALYDIAKKTGGSDIFVNSVACGLLASIVTVDFNIVEKVIRKTFGDKDEKILNKNILAAREGYDSIGEKYKRDIPQSEETAKKETFLINGNEAIALAAIKAGCKFYSAYPMTPSTSILTTIARYSDKFNILVEQAEDEIAAVNMAIGASFAGTRAITGTSGGGFALMTEGVSLAGMTETPVVIVDAQRPAPATGFPTRTEQGDLEFLLHGAHGEFAKVIYAPGSIEEAFYLTVKAFDIADKYQIPVLILTDQHLADSTCNMDGFDFNGLVVRKHSMSKEESMGVKDYKRYKITDSGISPRAIPSWIEDVIYVDSDEHTEKGHITEDAKVREKMVPKRLYKKMEGLLGEVEDPVAGNLDDADTILIGFGSTFGVIKEASARAENKNVGYIHLPQVWPLPVEKLNKLLDEEKEIVVVENNATGQLAKLLRRETELKVNRSILKYDGRPFNLDFVLRHI